MGLLLDNKTTEKDWCGFPIMLRKWTLGIVQSQKLAPETRTLQKCKETVAKK